MIEGNTNVSHFVVQRADLIVERACAFLVARAAMLSVSASDHFGCAEKLSAVQ